MPTSGRPAGPAKSAAESARYRQWEKDRRDRFNRTLDTLGQLLPRHANGSKPTTSDNKNRSKVEIVVSAIDYIKDLLRKQKRVSQVSINSPATHSSSTANCEEKVRLLRRQNRKLREVIRREFDLSLSETEFLQKNLKEILILIAEQKEKHRQREEKQNKAKKEALNGVDSQNTPEDVFVAPITCPSDHTYSIIVQDTPDVLVETQEVEIGNQEEELHQESVAETGPQEEEAGPAPDPESETEPEPVAEPENAPPVTKVVAPRPAATLFPTITFLTPTPLLLRPTQPCLRPIGNKLPIPRLRPSLAPVNAASRARDTAKKAKKESKKKAKKKEAKENSNESEKDLSPETIGAIVDQPSTSTTTSASPPATSTPSRPRTKSFDLSDVTNIETSLPETILATEEGSDTEETIPSATAAPLDLKSVETIDLTKEDEAAIAASGKTRNVVDKDKHQMIAKRALMKKSSSKKRPAHSTSSGSEAKRSKSSYSIAALCQISVNIGADTEPPPLVNSPGVASLASAGTASPGPIHSPTPTPPPRPPSVKAPPLAKEKPSATRDPGTAAAPPPKAATPKVIQELKSSPEAEPKPLSTASSKEKTEISIQDKKGTSGDALLATSLESKAKKVVSTSPSNPPGRLSDAKVLQELDPSALQVSLADASPAAVSPSKSYLSNFPVVSTASDKRSSGGSALPFDIKDVPVSKVNQPSLGSQEARRKKSEEAQYSRVSGGTAVTKSSDVVTSIAATAITKRSITAEGRKNNILQQPQLQQNQQVQPQTQPQSTQVPSQPQPPLQQQQQALGQPPHPPLLPQQAPQQQQGQPASLQRQGPASTANMQPQQQQQRPQHLSQQLNRSQQQQSQRQPNYTNSQPQQQAQQQTQPAQQQPQQQQSQQPQQPPQQFPGYDPNSRAVTVTPNSPNIAAGSSASGPAALQFSSHYYQSSSSEQLYQGHLPQQHGIQGSLQPPHHQPRYGSHYQTVANPSTMTTPHQDYHTYYGATAPRAGSYHGYGRYSSSSSGAGSASTGLQQSSKSSSSSSSRAERKAGNSNSSSSSTNRNPNSSMTSMPPPLPVQQQQQQQYIHNDQGKVFSVTQLVSSKQAQQSVGGGGRKSSKRSSSSSNPGSTHSTKTMKQQQQLKDSRYLQHLSAPDDIPIGGTVTTPSKRYKGPHTNSSSRSSSRGGSSKVKPSYSAESLISHPVGGINTTSMEFAAIPQGLTDSYSIPDMKGAPSSWGAPPPPDQGNSSSAPSSHLQFSSLSPSPANLFSTDFPTLEFSSALLGSSEMTASNVTTAGSVPPHGTSSRHNQSQTKAPSSTSSSSSTYGQFSTASGSGLQGGPNPYPLSSSATSSTSHQGQYFSSAIFDNTNLLPLPTITPPSTDDPYAHPPPFITSNSLYAGGSSSTTGQTRGGQGTSSSYPPLAPLPPPALSSAPTSSKNAASTTSLVSSGDIQHLLPTHPGPPSSTASTAAAASGSQLSNFNLSTIFPEINVNPKSGHGHVHAAPAPSLPPPPPAQGLIVASSSVSSSSSVVAVTSSSSTTVDMRQLTTPDILPPGLALLGHHPHPAPHPPSPYGVHSHHSVPHSQQAAASAGFPPPLNFQLPDQ